MGIITKYDDYMVSLNEENNLAPEIKAAAAKARAEKSEDAMEDADAVEDILEDDEDSVDENIVAGLSDVMNEGVMDFFKGKSPEEKRKAAYSAIMKHPSKKTWFKETKAKEPEKAEKYLQAVISDPSVKYWKWDKQKQNFVHAGSFSAGGKGAPGQN